MSTSLYLVTGEGDDTNLDLVVEATDAAEAASLWKGWVRKNFGIHSSYTAVFRLPPLTGTSHVVPWHTLNGMKQVLG
jgi:hypothetical protein